MERGSVFATILLPQKGRIFLRRPDLKNYTMIIPNSVLIIETELSMFLVNQIQMK